MAYPESLAIGLLRHRRRRGQAVVIMALAMVAIGGMVALAVDAGRLYFQRRQMQNAVDAGALAGAQDLIVTSAYPNGNPSSARYYALEGAFSAFNLSPTNPLGSSFYTPGNTVTDTQGNPPYTVTAVAPSGPNNKQVQVTMTYTSIPTVAEILGFNQVNLTATATAEAGTIAKNFAIYAYSGIGPGNLINTQLAGVGQVDNGQDGADACNLALSSVSISTAKFAIPLSTGLLNINGKIKVDPAGDNRYLEQFWSTAPAFATNPDPRPDYRPPDTAGISTLNPARYRVVKIPAYTGTAAVPGAPGLVLHNSTAAPHDYAVYFPGHYTTPITIPAVGDDLDTRYVFLNGVYWFTTPGTIAILGGTISNTSTGLPHYSAGIGATDLPPAADGTDGIQFYLDGTSAFTAANTSLTASSVFFVAPSILPATGGHAHIAFYIASSNIAPVSWTDQNFNATLSNAPVFQVWGTLFDGSSGGGSVYLRAVQLGPHNVNPTEADPSGQYAINGELIGYTMTLDVGNIFGSAAGSPPDCLTGTPNWTGHRGTPGLLVQYNKIFAPAPGANSYLVK
jgi:Flp pilus assembly protein TadG